jgi:hypothetical protein
MAATRPPIYGLMAEFRDANELVAAAMRTYESGYRRIDAFTPFPVEGLAEVMGFHDRRVPFIVLVAGALGAAGGYLLQYWASVVEYPMNIGGRPYHSWPAFIVPTFETTILCAAFGAVLGMLAMNGLPMPYHPVFNVPRFALASRDRFFLLIEARDAKFDRQATRRFLEDLKPREVVEVEH